MTSKLNVLSIDFDFFQIVTKETMTNCYPDGLDLPTDLSTFIWSSHYSNKKTNKQLQEIKINRKMLNEIKQIVRKNAKHEPKIMICNSHKHIHDLILETYDTTIHNGLNLINIDMHHDMFSNGAELDCGNWVSHITNAIPNNNVTWIANPISLPVFGNSLKDFCEIEYNFDSIKDTKFDIIFLCRSDIWLPPHLDIYFNELVQCFKRYHKNILAETCVLEPRNITEYTEKMTQAQKQLRSEINENQRENM